MPSNPPPVDFATAFVRLLSDPQARAEFRRDSAGLAMRYGLDGSETDLFVSLDAEAIQRQATGLIEKRLREVSRLIPVTWRAFGPQNAARIFRQFAPRSWPTGHRRHIADALAFGGYLVAHGSRRVCLAELNHLRFQLDQKRLQLKFARRCLVGERSGPGIQMMFRYRGETRYWLFYFPL